MHIKGILHCHSTYSYDGILSITELVSLSRQYHYDFLALTEHDDTIDENIMRVFVEECRMNSSSGFIIIPGIEFSFNEKLHLLAYGLTQYIKKPDGEHETITHIVDEIHKQNALAVLAHPQSCPTIPMEILHLLDGIEAWNVKWDSKYLPNIKVAFECQRPAFGGIDLHTRYNINAIHTTVVTKQFTEAAILLSLKKGMFWTSNNYVTLGADGRVRKNIYYYLGWGLKQLHNMIKTAHANITHTQPGKSIVKMMPNWTKTVIHKFY